MNNNRINRNNNTAPRNRIRNLLQRLNPLRLVNPVRTPQTAQVADPIQVPVDNPPTRTVNINHAVPDISVITTPPPTRTVNINHAVPDISVITMDYDINYTGILLNRRDRNDVNANQTVAIIDTGNRSEIILNNSVKIARDAMKASIQNGLEGNLDTPEKLNYAIIAYPDISKITHSSSIVLNIKFNNIIDKSDINLVKIENIVNYLNNKNTKKRKTEVDLLSRTDNKAVAKFALKTIKDFGFNDLFSEEQKNRLRAKANVQLEP